MGIVTSQVLGMLGKNILRNGLTPATFGRMLSSLGGPVSKLLPSGIGDVPGMSALADLGNRAAAASDAVVRTGERVGANVRGAYRETTAAAREGTAWLAALAPLLLLAIPLLAFAFLMRGAAAKLRNEMANADLNLPQGRAQGIQPPAIVPAAREPRLVPTVHVEEKLIDAKLPDGKSLKLPETSFLNKMYRYLTDSSAREGRRFVFDDLDFDAGKINVRPEIESSITQLTTLLGSFPNVNLRIDGYAARSADPAADKRLSLERAEELKSLLVKAGVPSERIKTSGYGSKKPAAPGETPNPDAKADQIELWLEKS
jgi:outer membrane protein OmpA-like peptidoglycan-associated protein